MNTAARNAPPDAPYFFIEFEGQAEPEGLVFAAGVCSEGETEVEVEIRRYAISLLLGFFGTKAETLKKADYSTLLRRTLHHIHERVAEKWGEHGRGLDMALVLASASKSFAARVGKGELFIFKEGEARSVFGTEGGEALLGVAEREAVEMAEIPLEPGCILVICNPAVARVIGARDMTLILRRASDPVKASLFLSAIAERKGAEGPMTALLWEVPNYQGAALLTEDATSAGAEASLVEERPAEEGGEQVAQVDQADQAKRRWLNKWRRHKESEEPEPPGEPEELR